MGSFRLLTIIAFISFLINFEARAQQKEKIEDTYYWDIGAVLSWGEFGAGGTVAIINANGIGGYLEFMSEKLLSPDLEDPNLTFNIGANYSFLWESGSYNERRITGIIPFIGVAFSKIDVFEDDGFSQKKENIQTIHYGFKSVFGVDEIIMTISLGMISTQDVLDLQTGLSIFFEL